VMTNFWVNLARLWYPIVWSNISLDVAMKVFLDVTFKSYTLSAEHRTLSYGWALVLSNHLKTLRAKSEIS
jgi:hypothetical protein